jgi:hypothetical protein
MTVVTLTGHLGAMGDVARLVAHSLVIAWPTVN